MTNDSERKSTSHERARTSHRAELYTNPCCIFLCCGGLPFLGALKGLLTVVPVMLALTTAYLFTALVMFPRTVWYLHKTWLITPRIGPNIKLIGAPFLWIPLVLWTLLAPLVGAVIGLGVGFGFPVIATFDPEIHVLGGWQAVFALTWRCIKGFVELNHERVQLAHLAWIAKTEGEPFDIPLWELPVGFAVLLSGVLYLGVLGTLLSILKLLPATLRTYFWYFYGYGTWIKEDDCFAWALLLPFVIGIPLVPVVVVLVALFCIIASWVLGVGALKPMHKTGIAEAFFWIGRMGATMDIVSNEYLFSKEVTLCPCQRL